MHRIRESQWSPLRNGPLVRVARAPSPAAVAVAVAEGAPLLAHFEKWPAADPCDQLTLGTIIESWAVV